MRLYFRLMLVMALASAGYAYIGDNGFFAHNHYAQRSQLLHEVPFAPHLYDALAPTELAKTDEHFANAYKAAVFDGVRLGNACEVLRLQSMTVSGFLFVSSIIGLRFSRKNNATATINA